MRTVIYNTRPKKESRRQKLREVAESGNLRYWLNDKMDEDTLNLLVDIVIRYCEPKK